MTPTLFNAHARFLIGERAIQAEFVRSYANSKECCFFAPWIGPAPLAVSQAVYSAPDRLTFAVVGVALRLICSEHLSQLLRVGKLRLVESGNFGGDMPIFIFRNTERFRILFGNPFPPAVPVPCEVHGIVVECESSSEIACRAMNYVHQRLRHAVLPTQDDLKAYLTAQTNSLNLLGDLAVNVIPPRAVAASFTENASIFLGGDSARDGESPKDTFESEHRDADKIEKRASFARERSSPGQDTDTKDAESAAYIVRQGSARAFQENWDALFGRDSKLQSESLEEMDESERSDEDVVDAVASLGAERNSLEPDIDVKVALSAFRRVLKSGSLADDDLLKQAARECGFAKATRGVRKVLKRHLRAAFLRRVVGRREDGMLILVTVRFSDYEPTELIRTISSVTKPTGRVWEREDVVRNVAAYFGFERVTDSVRERMKSALNSAIRKGILAREGQLLRRC
jgi:hypothetical protein